MGLKKIFILIFLFVSVYSFGQKVQFPFTYGLGYQRIGADTLLWIPSDTITPTAQLTGRTHLARKGTTVYYWNGSVWTAIGGVTYTAGSPIRITGTAFSVDTSFAFSPSLATNARLKKIVDSLNAAGWAIPTIQQVLAAGNTVTNDDLHFGNQGYISWDYANDGFSLNQYNTGNNMFFEYPALSATTKFNFPSTGSNIFYYPHTGRSSDTLATLYDVRAGGGGGGSGTVSRIGTIDSLAKAANGSQISGVSIIPQTSDSTYPGLLKNIDFNRSFKYKSQNNPTGTITHNQDSCGQETFFFTSTGGRTLAFSGLRRGDISIINFDNTSGADITLTLPSNSYVNYVSAATATIPANKSSLSLSAYDGTNYWFIQSIAGGAVAGLNKQVQFNNSGSIAGASGFEYQSGSSPNVSITAQNAAHTALTVKGTTSQSAAIFDVQTTSGANTGFRVDPGGGTQTFGTLSAPTGSGSIEMLYSGGVGTIQSYNRAGSYTPLTLDGNIKLNNAGSTRLTVGVQGIYVSTGTATPTAKIHIGAGTATASTAPLKFTQGTFLTTAEAGAMEFDSLKLTFTNATAIRQEVPLIQQSRVSTQFDKTSNVTLADITGLTGTLAAGRTYRFEARLYTTSNSAGGVQFAIGGTCSATAIIYEGLTTDAGLITQSRTTTKGNAVAAVTSVTAAYTVITGTITVNVAGTLTVQFAQNASNGTASSILVGSTFEITEML